MIRVRPIYKCRICSSVKYGEIMELSDRSNVDLLEDIMDFTAPVVEPHACFADNSQFGVWEYAGFNVVEKK